MKNENELSRETSPYLLQHAGNPVHWKAWSDKTIERAQQENKPLLISIGYAACHWCHVMEQETFEDAAAARLMNDNFICIKVDREERPDVDQVYMAAAQLIHGNGGWPLNALAFPDGKPFFAGTYFPKERWMEMLQYFIQQYKENQNALREQAESLAKGIRDYHWVYNTGEAPDFSAQDMEAVQEKLLRSVDHSNGGLAGNIKFPMPSIWELMMRLYFSEGDKRLLDAAQLTLDSMINGGIYDQLGGGFLRYATDASWTVPHFEKMLYDNALLISLYSRAFQLTGNEIYQKTVTETIEFIFRELAAPNGYYASIDADSDGQEGAYYAWTATEIAGVLKDDADIFMEAFGVTPGGNFEEGKNVLFRRKKESWHDSRLDAMRKKLLDMRQQRQRPATDDKILTAWNAMLSSAFTDAARAFQNEEYLDASRNILNFILSELLTDDNELYRNYQQKATTHAFLDDYAFLIKALIDFYQATFEEAYLEKARTLTEYVSEHFFDSESKMFFYNDARYQGVFTRPAEFSDNVIPSSNAVMAENLYTLGLLYHEDLWVGKAATMVKNLKQSWQPAPAYYSYWLQLLMRLLHPPFEIAITGSDAKDMLRSFQKHYLPDCIFCGSTAASRLPLLQQKSAEGQTLIYVCVNRACQRPVNSVAAALEQIKVLRHQ